MEVLTIKQPWATLIMQGNKRFEFRSWKNKYRGNLLIHAGKGIDKEALLKENADIYKNSAFDEEYGWQIEDVEVFDK